MHGFVFVLFLVSSFCLVVFCLLFPFYFSWIFFSMRDSVCVRLLVTVAATALS